MGHEALPPDPDMRVADFTLLQEHASVFRTVDREQVAEGPMIWGDFRFAGTFFLYDEVTSPEASLRRAVISYHPEERQYIVSEGDFVGGAEVLAIRAGEVVLRRGDEEGILPLGGKRTTTHGREQPEEGVVTDDAVVVTRFGEQTAAGTWSMNREALLAYYEELLDEPERLLQVFDSMQPIYTSDGDIEGYQLQTVGEAEFFEGVGFQEGDKVRAVNTLQMTNRRRAEFFIRQVVENDLNAIVIDIERDGNPQRLVYELR